MNTVCEWGEAAVINHDKKTIWPIKDSRHAKAPLALMIWPSLAASPMVNHSNQSLNQHWLELIFSSKIIISTTKLFVVHFKSKHIRDYQGWKISRYLFLSLVLTRMHWTEKNHVNYHQVMNGFKVHVFVSTSDSDSDWLTGTNLSLSLVQCYLPSTPVLPRCWLFSVYGLMSDLFLVMLNNRVGANTDVLEVVMFTLFLVRRVLTIEVTLGQ